MKTNPNDSAFPMTAGPWVESERGPIHPEAYGLTKREEIAKAVLQGFAANTSDTVGQAGAEQRALWAIQEADALIHALNASLCPNCHRVMGKAGCEPCHAKEVQS